jgi:ribosomal protein S18 acetylase RimI-like enzyme
MRIRPATIADIDRCIRLDSGAKTEYVWQIDQNAGVDRVTLDMRRIRLPRVMELPYPRSVVDLQEDWQLKQCFVVADEFTTLLGYLDLTVTRWQWVGTIEHLVVDRAQRRKGVATQLLGAAERWARGSGLHRVVVVVQPKNDPAIRLFTKLGYVFAGLIDHYYGSDATSLVYALDLEAAKTATP